MASTCAAARLRIFKYLKCEVSATQGLIYADRQPPPHTASPQNTPFCMSNVYEAHTGAACGTRTTAMR